MLYFYHYLLFAFHCYSVFKSVCHLPHHCKFMRKGSGVDHPTPQCLANERVFTDDRDDINSTATAQSLPFCRTASSHLSEGNDTGVSPWTSSLPTLTPQVISPVLTTCKCIQTGPFSSGLQIDLFNCYLDISISMSARHVNNLARLAENSWTLPRNMLCHTLPISINNNSILTVVQVKNLGVVLDFSFTFHIQSISKSHWIKTYPVRVRDTGMNACLFLYIEINTDMCGYIEQYTYIYFWALYPLRVPSSDTPVSASTPSIQILASK